MKTPRTKLESFLFWWLAANSAVFGLLVLLVVVLPSPMAAVQVNGPLSLAVLGVALVFGVLVYLTWRLRTPTPGVLLFGAILFFLMIVQIEWPGGSLSLNPGLAFRFTIMDDPSFTVKLNVVAIPIFILFLVARHRRVSARQTDVAGTPDPGTNDR